MQNVQSIDDIDSVTNLMQSSEFHEYMRDIKERVGENPKPWFGLIEQNPEYLLVKEYRQSPLLFTKAEVARARKRAEKNPEDTK